MCNAVADSDMPAAYSKGDLTVVHLWTVEADMDYGLTFKGTGQLQCPLPSAGIVSPQTLRALW